MYTCMCKGVHLMNVCMYVCMYICTVHVHMYIHTYMYVHTYRFMYTCMYVYMYICTSKTFFSRELLKIDNDALSTASTLYQ